jgi:hypothetical protein
MHAHSLSPRMHSASSLCDCVALVEVRYHSRNTGWAPVPDRVAYAAAGDFSAKWYWKMDSGGGWRMRCGQS